MGFMPSQYSNKQKTQATGRFNGGLAAIRWAWQSRARVVVTAPTPPSMSLVTTTDGKENGRNSPPAAAVDMARQLTVRRMTNAIRLSSFDPVITPTTVNTR